VPELPAEVLPAAKHPKQHRKCFRNLFFHRRKLSGKSEEDAKKNTVCPELLQLAAASTVAPF